MIALGRRDEATFFIHTTFQDHFLLPVEHYVNWKLKHDWDDYNELYHCQQFISEVSLIDDVWVETHTIEKKGDIVGVLLIVGGELQKLSIPGKVDSTTILLKYFHIIDKGNGYGTYWIKHILIPYYYKRGIKTILVSSSHPMSFPFYERLGEEISSFVKKSDNGRFERQCKSFRITLEKLLH